MKFLLILTILCLSGCKSRSERSVQKDLDNKHLIDISHSDPSPLYSNILAVFKPHSDQSNDSKSLNLDWPLKDRPNLLTRAGTPTYVLFEGISEQGFSFLHEALDIAPFSPGYNGAVYAPLGGKARLISQNNDNDPDSNHYDVAVAIKVKDMNFVVSILHINPDPGLSFDKFVELEAGDIIGKLTPVDSMSNSKDAYDYRHVHLSIFDLDNKAIVNPIRNIKGPKDEIMPVINNVYLLDEDAKISKTLKDGKFDVLVEVWDRDNNNNRNFEVANFTFSINTEFDTLIDERHCDLEPLVRGLQITDIRNLIDFSAAGGQLYSNWQEIKTDANNPNRSFRYAITNMQVSNSSCLPMKDEDGFIEITPDINQIEVSVKVADYFGNETTKVFIISR